MNITLFTRPKSVLTVGLALLLAFDPKCARLGADCRVPRLRPGIPLVRHASRQEWRRTRKPFLIQAICTFLISPDSSPFVPSALLVATGARGRLILSTTRISCRRT